MAKYNLRANMKVTKRGLGLINDEIVIIRSGDIIPNFTFSDFTPPPQKLQITTIYNTPRESVSE